MKNTEAQNKAIHSKVGKGRISDAELSKRPMGNGLITDEERNSPDYKKWLKGKK